MRFSIIIPVYNVEKYIRKCMETVMGQTFRDYEVIVVDDESPDNSMKIVEEFAEKYPGQIKMIHQKNTRQGGARNRGVREATGEYLIFVDSDDYVSLDMLETVDLQLKANDCDILVFKYQMVTTEGKYLGEGGFGALQPGVYIPSQNKEILNLPAGPVHKAYRREFYVRTGVMFPEKLLYEDAVVRLLFASASSVVLHDAAMYYYVQSNNSSIRQKPSPKMLDILEVSDIVLRQFREKGLYEDFKEPLEVSLIYGIAYIIDRINQMDPRDPLQITMADYIRSNFPNYQENPYMEPRFRKSIDYLVSHDFVKYHYCYLLISQAKEWLLRFKIVAFLNRLRKNRKL